MPNVDPSLEKLVNEFNEGYAKGDAAWFELFADDATIYASGSAEPIRGKKAYQKAFQQLLESEQRQIRVLQQDIQVLDDSAIVMQFLEISSSLVTSNLRESSIWKRDGKNWIIVHLHAASVGTARADVQPKTANAVKVLNEKIFTVSAHLGVAQ